VTSLGEHTLLLRHTGNVSTVFVVVHLKDSATVTVEKGDAQKWEVLLTTEDSTCTSEPMPITIEPNGSQALVHFFRPGAAVLRVV